MGLLDGILGPAVNVATNAVATHDQAALQAKIQQRNQAIQDLLMQHQFGKDQAHEDYERAMAAAAGKRGAHYQYQDTHPRQPDPHYFTGDDGTEMAVTDPTKPALAIQGPNGQPAKAHLPPAPMPFTTTNAVDKDGNPIVAKVDKRTGDVSPTGVGAKPNATAGGGRETAQLSTASGQAIDADKSMTPFEDDLLGKRIGISATDAALAKKMFSGGSLASATAESVLNQSNPRLAQYVRDAKAMATAERMITPRGGSNMTTQAEAMLSGVGPNATPAQVQRARQYRARLVQGLQQHAKQGATQDSAEGTGAAGEQRAAYDAAASALKASGASASEIAAQIGARP